MVRTDLAAALALFGRRQPVTPAMVALFAIIPAYLFIGGMFRASDSVHVPQVALDRMLPLWPGWSLVYGSLFLAALLPVFVIHQRELVDRTIRSFLFVWLAAYAVFLFYPTVASHTGRHEGEGFSAAALRLIYDSDTRWNCFPSLHVAQCFLAAFACHRVHRGVGRVASAWASLVALSTLFTKQHYVLDVVGGVALASAGAWIGLRGFPREAVPREERELAPLLALAAFGAYGLLLAALRIGYALAT